MVYFLFFLGATPLYQIFVAPKVGGEGVALEVNEIVPLKNPLCTLLNSLAYSKKCIS